MARGEVLVSTPFLTSIDPRAAVKGSRDPLGAQQLWTKLGRRVVGNLTTVSTSARDFTITMLGHHFANLIAQEDPAASRLDTFIRWEQLAAHVRAYENDAKGFRGSERVEKTLSEGPKFVLSADRRFQILSSQKMYGLWGLYTVPARASGLLEGDPAVPTEVAKAQIDQILKRVAGARIDRLLELLLSVLRKARRSIELESDDANLSKQLGALLSNRLLRSEASFYEAHLVRGGPGDTTCGRQAQLAELLSETATDRRFGWSPSMVGELAKRANARGGEWRELAAILRQIETCANVLNAASRIFDHLLTRDDSSFTRVASEYARHFGGGLRTVDPDHFDEILGARTLEISSESTERWCKLARALATGDYPAAMRALMQHNAAVMAARGGQVWIAVDNGRLRVHMADQGADLPSERELRGAWDFPFFLNSLRDVVLAVEEARRG
jgi:hypothetical protein